MVKPLRKTVWVLQNQTYIYTMIHLFLSYLHYPKEIKTFTHKNVCMRIFIVSFIIVKITQMSIKKRIKGQQDGGIR